MSVSSKSPLTTDDAPHTGPVEAPLVLTTEPPRPLGFLDQLATWGNFGISLFGPLTGALVATTTGSVAEGIGAIVVGCVLGAVLLGASAVFGTVTGAPAMVALRGLFGRRGSIVPTILNIGQNIGWATMEIIVISTAAVAVIGQAWRWPFVLLAGAAATVMAVRPLGSVRLLRKVMVWLVLAASVFLFVEVLLRPRQAIPQDGVLGFWPAVDLAVAGVVSFAPLAADYSRHSRTSSAAFWGSSLGYGLAAVAYYTLGVFAVANLGASDVIGALVALPAGAVALGILLVDEVDEAFANVYSTTMSVQNLLPRLDRRYVAVAVGIIATLLAGLLDFSRYQSFLFLIGSVFVPLFAVATVDFYLVSRQRWDVSARSRLRATPVIAWACGFVAYQLVYPGDVPGWADFWAGLAKMIGFSAPTWLGSSVAAIGVGGLAMLILGYAGRAVRTRS
ncbi:putative hydroxymethylpyrimidine transporter CytX [Microlunatus panaciterrae]|uniref:Hydroxymethylpyrimidine transporter CytX n=1 Tax=Microlunatus panaciterrae TaxID=400768 RepID=A0ABS2RK06_9ACTN|nr:cytosine permease [Microlunatus panaciterrae]MBM7799058.1 putative hydroxymethylpyrimidine transporter CytX [Microlunatus panaciterrae]